MQLPAFVVAHEIGHNVALQLGLWPPLITIKQSELLADCAAGAWGQDVATRGLLGEGDLEQIAQTLMLIGDPAWTWFNPFMHGTPQQRALAFGVGFFGGPWACLSENQTPTAVIISPGQDTTITIGNAVDFQGTATDPDGAVLLHVWDFGDGATSTAEDPGLHTYASTGTYVARYIVSDNVGASSETDSVTITVVSDAPHNQPPVATIDNPGQDTTVTFGDAVDFQGTASDPDGVVVTHTWNLGDGTITHEADPGLHTYASAGTYVVTYQVTDDNGASSGIDSVTVNAVPPSSNNFALDFNQSYVNIPDNNTLDLSATWTLEAWVFPRAAGNGSAEDLISKWDGGGNASYIMQIDYTGVLRLVTHDGTNTVMLGQTLIANDTWQHVAATFSSGTVNLYINGTVDATFTDAVVPMNSTQPLAFGREGDYSGRPFNGIMDELRIWSVVRSGTDLATYRTQRLTGTETGLVGYWRFDEGSGNVAFDATGNGNNGRLGTSVGVDAWDPQWTTNSSPIP